MAKKNSAYWETAGLLFVLVAGNLLHFVYDWSGRSAWVAAFAATNESTWEHMKLLAVPWLLWSLLECLVLPETGVPFARAAGLLAGLAFIPTVFYTYQGILGRNIDWVNILLFQAASVLAYIVTRQIQMRSLGVGRKWQLLGLFVLLSVAALFVVWTYRPPQWGVFLDPLRATVGRVFS